MNTVFEAPMSGATIHHVTVGDWKDAMLARAYVRTFAGLFLADERNAGYAASAVFDVVTRMKAFTGNINLNIEAELDSKLQFIQVFIHGFDVHIAAHDLEAKVLGGIEYLPTLKASGCELTVAEKPGFGTIIALTIPAAGNAGFISKRDLMERMPKEPPNAGLLEAEISELNRQVLSENVAQQVSLRTAFVDPSQPVNPFVEPFQPVTGGGLEFIGEELRETRRNLKTAVERYGALVELKNTLRKQLEDLRSLLSDSSEPMIGGVGRTDIKDALKQIASISAQIESHLAEGLDVPIYDIEVNRFAIGDIFGVLQTVFNDAARQKHIELKFELDPAVPEMNTDKSRTIRILHHLADNALKFTEKGSVVISAAKASHKGEIVFTVEDTGIGISQDHHRNIFGDGRSYGVLGLGQFSGLPVAKELVRSLGGKIAVDSQVGRGSKFTIVLPLDFEAQPESKAAQDSDDSFVDDTPVAEPSADKDTAVLIVEDDDATQFLMKKILSTEYTCYGAASASEAFAILGKHSVRFIYMDIALRGSIDGIELTRQLRSSEEWKDIPIIALTSFTHDMTRGEALCAGCDDYLTKPINKAEVLEKVKEYIRPYKPEELSFIK